MTYTLRLDIVLRRACDMPIYAWAQAAFTSGVLEVDPVEKALLNKYTFRARESLQKINTFIHTQLPLPYIHILVLLTKIFFMLSCLQVS